MRMRLPAVAAGVLAVSPAVARPPEPIPATMAATGRVVLPLTVRSGFAFVKGEAQGRKGYFMLDTGTPYAVFLNNARLPLPPGRRVSAGSASSGQKIVVFRYGCLDGLRFAGEHTLADLCDLPGADLGFVEGELKLPLLGFLGDDLFRSYRFTLDWRNRRATLDDGRRPVARHPVTTFRFAAADRQVPRIAVTAGNVRIAGGMDSGDPGHVRLTRADADALLASGDLVSTRRLGGATTQALAHVDHDGARLDTSGLPVTIGGDRSDIMLGFRFLRRYRSAWDYGRGTVDLYR